MKKSLFIIISMCCVGFIIGFCSKNLFLSSLNAAEETNTLESTLSLNSESEFNDIFSSDIYDCLYNDKTSVYHFVYNNTKAKAKDVSVSQNYTKKDVVDLAKKMIDNKYDLILGSESSNDVMYQEVQGKYPTGGYASFVFDDSGKLIEAYCRKGVIYDVDESKIISYEKAFDISEKSLVDRYGDTIEVLGNASDYEYEIYYKPDIGKLCYNIKAIECSNGEDEELLYYITVSVDGEYTSIAWAK